jgi:hypothetical protein
MAVVEGAASRDTIPEVVQAVAAPNRAHYQQEEVVAVEAEPTNDLVRRSPD